MSTPLLDSPHRGERASLPCHQHYDLNGGLGFVASLWIQLQIRISDELIHWRCCQHDAQILLRMMTFGLVEFI